MFERIQLFLRQFQAQSSQFYGGLTRGRKIALTVILSAIVSALLALAVWKPTVKYEQAYSNLSAEDKSSILGFLKKNNMTNFRMDGDGLQFPEDKALQWKMDLAQEGLPNSGVGVGWEKFDEQNFAATDFQHRINRVRALQGELSRTINKLAPVESSRVHIVLPDAAIFAEDKRVPTASISVRLRAGRTLTPRQVQGVLHLSAHAVEGLTPQNIALVDQDGNMLSKPDEDDGGFDKISSAQRDYQKRFEKEQEQKIREILTRVVGEGKVIAKVDSDLDFKKIETTVSDIDPERTAVVSSQRNEQSSNGSGMNPTGVPGTKSNLPGEKEDLASGGSSASNKQNSETLNYEVKKTLSKIIEPIGGVKKISVAVIVDGKMVDGKYVPRPPEEMAMITKLVKNAIGFQETRDSLSVENTPFEQDEFARAEQAMLTERKTSLLQTGIYASVAVGAMVFLFFAIVKPYFRWLTFDPNKRTQEQFAVVDYELERSGGAAKRVQVQEEVPFEKLSPKEQIMYLAKHDPKKTTEALRQLLSPNYN